MRAESANLIRWFDVLKFCFVLHQPVLRKRAPVSLIINYYYHSYFSIIFCSPLTVDRLIEETMLRVFLRRISSSGLNQQYPGMSKSVYQSRHMMKSTLVTSTRNLTNERDSAPSEVTCTQDSSEIITRVTNDFKSKNEEFLLEIIATYDEIIDKMSCGVREVDENRDYCPHDFCSSSCCLTDTIYIEELERLRKKVNIFREKLKNILIEETGHDLTQVERKQFHLFV